MISDPSAVDVDRHEADLRELNEKVAPLRWSAVALFVVYAATVLGTLIPLQLRDAVWQQSAVNVLINNAVIPLVGLALLQLLRLIHPDLRPTRELLRSTSRWALPAAIGFLLLVPVQGAVAFRVLNQTDARDLGRSQETRQQIGRLRVAIQTAGTSQELIRSVPGLPPPVAAQLSGLSLAEARQRLLANLDRSEAIIKPQLGSAQANRRWVVAREALRNIVASVALAAAFFALRRRRRAA